MVELEKPRFDPAAFLASVGLERRIIRLAPKGAFFSQGDPADSVFYLQKGRAEVTVVSAAGKEATITLLTAGVAMPDNPAAKIAAVAESAATTRYRDEPKAANAASGRMSE